ncbi:MAG: biotin transporter BioY [Phycisphaerae bacterium]
MQQIAFADSFLKARYEFFKWRYNLAIVQKLTLALAMAGITGLAAQIHFMLPWTPVPISGQTFAVLLAGIILGGGWGGVSQVLYLVLGLAGVPWFAGTGGEYLSIFGPSGGYILGFIFAALFLGHVCDKYVRARNFLPMVGLMLFANFVLIYIPGLIQLGLWCHIVKGSAPSIGTLFLMGAAPFILGDCIKILAAAAFAKGITPKETFMK